MRDRKRLQRTLGAILFAVGFVLGFVIFAGMVWADFEAAMFDTSIRGEGRLRTLRCPVLIAEDETGTVSAAFHNPLDRPVNFFVRTHISQGFVTLMREERELLPVAPGETERLEWTVTADDAAYGAVVLVRVLLAGNYPLPARDASCGILALGVPLLGGRAALTLGVVASLLCMAAGGGLWLAGNRPLSEGFRTELARGMGALAASVLLGLFVGFVGWWLLGALVVIATLLAIVEVLRHVMQGG